MYLYIFTYVGLVEIFDHKQQARRAVLRVSMVSCEYIHVNIFTCLCLDIFDYARKHGVPYFK